MNDMQRTLTYVAVAVVASVIAWEPWRSTRQVADEPEEVLLFPEFRNPLNAKSLEIVKYNEETSTLEPPFKVAQLNGVWSIPSHHNYPADAHDHMAKAATSVMDLEALGPKISDNPGDQELYGVVDPDMKTLRAGSSGVGIRATLRDVKDEVLADLIIGKPVKDQPDLRYVRKAGSDRIYKVALKTEALTTKFEDWIEKDLLKLKSMDVKNVELNDYSSDMTPEQGQIFINKIPRSKILLSNDDAASKWDVLELTEYDKKSNPVAKSLGKGEELNTQKLNDMKRAISDLKIVDVQPKPKGLSKDFRASKDLAKDNEAIASLIQKGFYPVPVGEDKIEIYSGDGEVVCGLKDGVEYVLRFGNATGTLSKEDDKKEDGKKDDGKPSAEKMNRYIFVMAQLNKDLIPKPELEPLDGEDNVDKKAADKKADDKKADDKADKKADDKKADDKADKAKAKNADDEAAEEEAARKADERRSTIEKQNKRKQADYDDKVKQAEKRVDELNERFGGWYYVIPDSVYRNIHLSRADIVKSKEKPADKDADHKLDDEPTGDFKLPKIPGGE